MMKKKLYSDDRSLKNVSIPSPVPTGRSFLRNAYAFASMLCGDGLAGGFLDEFFCAG